MVHCREGYSRLYTWYTVGREGYSRLYTWYTVGREGYSRLYTWYTVGGRVTVGYIHGTL